MCATSRIRDLRFKRPVIKDNDFSSINVTALDDHPKIESDDATMARSRRFMPRFSSPPDPGNRPPRAMLGIPKFKKLLPKNAIARPVGAAALVMDSFFGLFVFFTIKPYLDTIPTSPFDWSSLLGYIQNTFVYLINGLKGRSLIGFVAIGLIALLITCMWGYSDRNARNLSKRGKKILS